MFPVANAATGDVGLLRFAASEAVHEALTPEPLKFDPTRFSDDNVRNRHKFAWVPFSGGAHMCLGLHFAYMQAKVFFYHLLTTSEIEIAPGYNPTWAMWPIPKPRDGLAIKLRRLR